MEHIYFQQNGITVTNSRFIVGNQTFAMRNVSSVQAVRYNASKGGSITLLTIGGVMLFIGFSVSGFWALFGLLMIGLGILWLSKLRPTFSVILATTGGEVRALQSFDMAFINAVVAALNQSMISHG